MPPKKPMTPMTPMGALGASDEWVSGKANQVRIGNLFLASISISNPQQSALWGTDWGSVPEEQICTKDFFALLATFLVQEYVIEEDPRDE